MIDLMSKLMLLYYTGQAHRFKRKYENVYQKSVVSLVQIHSENTKQKKKHSWKWEALFIFVSTFGLMFACQT